MLGLAEDVQVDILGDGELVDHSVDQSRPHVAFIARELRVGGVLPRLDERIHDVAVRAEPRGRRHVEGDEEERAAHGRQPKDDEG